MADCYVGEIRLFAGGYAPAGWHICDGTILSIYSYQQLFSLIGTTYGGDGRTTFGIPDFRGRIPVGMGTGTGLTARTIGQTGGAETVTLTDANLPAHNHTLNATTTAATLSTPNNALLAQPAAGGLYNTGTTMSVLADQALAPAGGPGVALNNMMPTTTMTYIIALNGMFPSRP